MEDEKGDKIKRTTLVVKNVDPHWRNLFTAACSANGVDRGEVIADLMRKVVENTYGVERAKGLYEDDIEYKAYLKRKNMEKRVFWTLMAKSIRITDRFLCLLLIWKIRVE